jgi:hypothetical protein
MSVQMAHAGCLGIASHSAMVPHTEKVDSIA